MTNSTTFTQGTTITSAWLNDVNTKTFNDDASTVFYTPAGVGAVETTVQNKLRESVSVDDYGADPTGLTDSSAAFIAALTGNEIVNFPGDYLCSLPVSIPANRLLVGGGTINASAELQATGSRAYVFTCSGDNIVFDRMKISVDESVFTTNPLDQAKVGAIYATTKDSIKLINCSISGGANRYQASGWLQTPLVWFNDSTFISLINCDISGNYSVGAPTALASEICFFDGCSDVQVNGGLYRKSWYSCIGVAASASSASERVTIDGVIGAECIGSVVSFNAIDSVISNCILSYSRDQVGIAMGHPASLSTKCKAIGNTIFKCGRGGITINYADAVVAGNTIYDCNELSPSDLYAAGIVAGDASGSPTDRRRCVIQGNNVKGCYGGIVVSDSSVAGEDGGDFAIVGNLVSYCTSTGIYTQAPRTIISGNVVKSNAAGIQIATIRSENSICTGNSISDNTSYGIYCAESTATNIVIYGNVLANNGANTIQTNGGEMYLSTRTLSFDNPSTSTTTGDTFFALKGYNRDASAGGAGRSGGLYHEAADASGVSSKHRLETFYVTGGVHTMMDSMVVGPNGWQLKSFWDTNTYYLWVDTTGRLRIKNSAPSSATDGTVVGTQV